MENWLIGLIILGAGFIISLFFESIRDFYSDLLGDIFGDFGDGVIYAISFEWISDIPEFFGFMFEGIGEFSIYGVAFGSSGVGLIYFVRDYMITPFVQYYTPAGQIFWTVTTYLTVFIGGYFMGKYFENTG